LNRKIATITAELKTISQKESDLEQRLFSLIERIKEENESQAPSVEKTKSKAKPDKGSVKSSYMGGIPVEREYVVFIVDTSGSMKRFWPIVEKQVNSILSIHPAVKGIQIMSDNGGYLLQGYSSKWIPDSRITRRRILDKLKTWHSFSNSNPTKGLEKALRFHSRVPGGIAIYVLGDDFTGSSYDQVMSKVKTLNRNNKNNEKPAQIHGIAFPWGVGDRFSTLMRELALRNDGVFVTIHFPLKYGRNSMAENKNWEF
ncbi:MAG: vWA domain-containing protein, partial [Pseudomonadota bacterium]|nr:vWA domain-containing protein [Pseudomonadota bacterium]